MDVSTSFQRSILYYTLGYTALFYFQQATLD